MTIRRSLYRMELNQPKGTEDLLPHLSTFMGQVDATLFPPRYEKNIPRWHSQMDGVRSYHLNGLSYTIEGSGDSSWKQSQRIRSALIAQGWCVDLGGGKMKISLEGDTIGRTACNLPNLNSEITRIFFDHLGTLRPERGNCWISESSWFGLENDDYWDDIFTMTELSLPLLSSRSIESTSSTTARCFYRRLADSLPKIAVPETERSDQALDCYSSAFVSTMDQRKSLEYQGSQIWIPLSGTR